MSSIKRPELDELALEGLFNLCAIFTYLSDPERNAGQVKTIDSTALQLVQILKGENRDIQAAIDDMRNLTGVAEDLIHSILDEAELIAFPERRNNEDH